MNAKKDLVTSIFLAIIGFLIAFIFCNVLITPPEKKPVKVIETTVSADLTDPDAEVFNYRALNPTVEVYVGDCTEFNEYGECVESAGNTVRTSSDDIIIDYSETNQENF